MQRTSNFLKSGAIKNIRYTFFAIWLLLHHTKSRALINRYSYAVVIFQKCFQLPNRSVGGCFSDIFSVPFCTGFNFTQFLTISSAFRSAPSCLSISSKKVRPFELVADWMFWAVGQKIFHKKWLADVVKNSDGIKILLLWGPLLAYRHSLFNFASNFMF